VASIAGASLSSSILPAVFFRDNKRNFAIARSICPSVKTANSDQGTREMPPLLKRGFRGEQILGITVSSASVDS